MNSIGGADHNLAEMYYRTPDKSGNDYSTSLHENFRPTGNNVAVPVDNNAAVLAGNMDDDAAGYKGCNKDDCDSNWNAGRSNGAVCHSACHNGAHYNACRDTGDVQDNIAHFD